MVRETEVLIDCAKLRALLLDRCGLSLAALRTRLEDNNVVPSTLMRMIGGSMKKPASTVVARSMNLNLVLRFARSHLGLSESDLPEANFTIDPMALNELAPPPTPFSELLSQHLAEGTRPDGSKTPWSDAEFAKATGWNSLAVRQWCAGGMPPGDIATIVRALFGDTCDQRLLEARRRLNEVWTLSCPRPPTPNASSFPKDIIRSIGQSLAIRSIEVAILADTLGRAVLVQGGPGIGKTTLTLEASDGEAARARFGDRRWVAYLEAATDISSFDAALARALGLDPSSGRFETALAVLENGSGLLVLDNLETPWEADRAGLERRLRQLQGVADLVLLASVRGVEVVGGAGWSSTIEVTPLTPPDDRLLFLRLAPRIAATDPHLGALLADLAGIPLAITLVGLRASPFESLAEVWQQWCEQGVKFARRTGLQPTAQTSLERSIEFSVTSNRIKATGHHLFRVLGFLPAGLRAVDRNALFGLSAFEGAFELLAVGLGHERADRLVLLPPVRHYARLNRPVGAQLRRQCVKHMLDLLANAGSRIWSDGGGEAIRRLWPEWENLEAALEQCIIDDQLEPAVRVMKQVSRLLSTTGGGTDRVIARLEEACRQANNLAGQAVCALTRGEIAVYRSGSLAEKHFMQAAFLAAKVSNAPGAPICAIRAKRGLAEVEIRRGHFEVAEPLLRASLQAAIVAADHFGHGYALKGLGDCAARRNRLVEAKAYFEAALVPAKKGGDVIGVANATKDLADIATAEDRLDDAVELTKAAGALYAEIEIILGDANCRLSLGDIQVKRADQTQGQERELLLENALAIFTAMRPLYVRVGDVLGQGNCFYNTAEVERRLNRQVLANDDYREALALYERVREPTSIGLAKRGLALMCRGMERQSWLNGTREAWADLPHLLLELDRDLVDWP